ncbi:ovalbumin-related protein X-like isoform X2 [Venturia canescens]|nr:ovalbumin-related protein X-like isoform X2 [Venturia canescens]XP_043280194.1 ovalbumin-related protein X-like isoform X2 [Venturia canescens]XP_043280195.1 ovalbumin-related protein X-like isoform X2 [Venturia canescens]XP_043280197.1 ovalbumin-related protein X-like isoform X2 [Venturia canescens]
MSHWILIIITFHSITMASLQEEIPKMSLAVDSCCQFSSKFHRAIAQKVRDNIVDSPLGIHLVLSYLFHGSNNHTAEEIKAGLSLFNTDQLHLEYGEIMKSLNSIISVELSMTNGIFLQEGVQLYKTFHSRGIEFYNFTIENLDFRDNVRSTEKINSWVFKNTNNKIKNIVSSDEIDESTKVILAGAVYFKAQWRQRFDPTKTEKKIFHATKTRNNKVDTMFKEYKYRQGEIPSLNCRFIEIPYMNGDIDMVILLPNEIEGLKDVEENFDWSTVVNAKSSTRLTRLYLPKFKIEATIDLKDTLIELGFTSMFEDNADLTKMSYTPLKVDKVVQKAFIDVDEDGTEAAATTVVQMRLKRSLVAMDEIPDEFIVDRPFIAAVRHVSNNIPLFFSSIRDIGTTLEKDEL